MKKMAIGMVGMCLFTALSLVGCQTDDPYGKLNDLIAKTSSSVELSITVQMDGESLQGTYEVTAQENGYRAVYSYERLNTFEKTEDGYSVPDAVKAVYQGSVVVEDGKIIEQDGAAADIAFEQMTAEGVTFDESYFTEASIAEDCITAKVVDTEAFLGKAFDCTEMSMEVHFTEEAVTSLTVSYRTADAAQVVIEYRFG